MQNRKSSFDHTQPSFERHKRGKMQQTSIIGQNNHKATKTLAILFVVSMIIIAMFASMGGISGGTWLVPIFLTVLVFVTNLPNGSKTLRTAFLMIFIYAIMQDIIWGIANMLPDLMIGRGLVVSITAFLLGIVTFMTLFVGARSFKGWLIGVLLAFIIGRFVPVSYSATDVVARIIVTLIIVGAVTVHAYFTNSDIKKMVDDGYQDGRSKAIDRQNKNGTPM